MTESMTQTKTQRSSQTFSKGGPAIYLSDAEKMQVFIDNPEALERLKDRTSFVCEDTGLTMVKPPTYTFNNELKAVQEQQEQRHISGQRTIKPLPKAKPLKIASPADKIKHLPKGMFTRLTKNTQEIKQTIDDANT